MAAVLPVSFSWALGRKATPIAMAALGGAVLLRLAGVANDGPPAQHTPQPLRSAEVFLRQPPPVARVGAAVLGGSARGVCVMALGANGKVSIGFEDPRRDVIVSLSA
jgi:hypothetical protein